MKRNHVCAGASSDRATLVRVAVFLFLILSALVYPSARAAQLTFRWDYGTSGAAGFVLYCGTTSHNYTTRIDVGNTETYTLAGLAEGATYFCAATAYDPSKVESTYSSEIGVPVPYAVPNVGFSMSPASGTAPLNVTFSNTTTGTVTTWAWDFGDGTTSTASNPTHSYSQAGSFTASLTATGPGGTSSYTATTPITVNATAPVAKFSMTPTSGSAPLNVTFTNTTTGTATTWAWDFGDGTTSTVKSPTHTYSQPGSYTVTLTASGAAGSSTQTASTPISVSAAPPVPNFTIAPTSGVAPLNVTFTNTTTGAATTWAWDFGDGTTSSVQSPSHSYSNPGSYTVKLTATGPGGSVTKTASTAISVTPPAPVANFGMTPTSGVAPLTVTFTNTTTGTATTWAWDFGDGTTSTASSPTHSYSNPGSYTVKLTATGPGGSSTQTASTPISVTAAAPVASFSMTPTSGVAPLSVAFTNTTTGTVTTWAWDFGDGVTSTLKTPTHSYSNPGSYTVKLTATGPGGSATQTASTPISVAAAAPVANFSMTPASGVAPLNVTFTNSTTGTVTTWAWDFGDGTTSSVQSPTHSYSNPGSYTVKLTATGPGGSASKTASTPISVTTAPPVANFSMTPTSGVAPLNVGFTDTTTGTVTTWAWNFGDGTTSSVQSPSHSYSNPGSYTVTLKATGPGGSSTKTASTPISVAAAAPVANFSMTPASGVAPLNVTFANSTTGTVTTWAWDFGDGTTSTASNPAHSYSQPGSYTVTLKATGPGGTSTKTASAPISVTAAAPVANFSMTPASGVAPLSVTFTNTTTGNVTTWAWDFGDGTTSNVKSPSHGYDSPGSYTVKLTATGPGGTTTKTASAPINVTQVPAPVANFAASATIGAAPMSVSFSNTTTGNVTSWAWDFGDGTTSNVKSSVHVYGHPGNYMVKLTATGPGGIATKTAAAPIKVSPPPAPVANFAVRPAAGIAPLTVSFINTTVGRVDSWDWDFGDGTRMSDVKSPVHVYTQPGSYTVTLTATNLGGTSVKTTATPIVANPPPLPVVSFAITPPSGDVPLTVHFTNRTTGKVDSLTWDFGDGGTSTELNPTHVFTQVGNYTVKLTATNLGGTSTKTSVTPIAVTMPSLPLVNFSYTPASGYAPLTVHFTNRTTGKIDSWVWDFGDGTTSTELNPTHIYAQIGSYTIKLSATNHTGTSTKTSITPIAVTLPLVNFTFTPPSGYTPLTVHFTNRTVGKVDSWAWDFGDNTTSTELSPTHVYTHVGNYTVKLTATSSAGTSTKTSTIPIAVTLPPAPIPNFSMTPAGGTAPLSVQFVNVTTGKADTWSWDFGDGQTSTDKSPIHVYTQVGSYTVKLTANGPGGSATKSAAKPIAVTLPPAPVANFGVTPVTGYAPLSVRFVNVSVGKVDSWAWNFGDGGTSTEKSPTHLYAQPGSYTVTLTATNLGGTSTKVSSAPIVATLPPLPVPNFSVTPASGYVPLTVHFTNRTTGKVDSLTWDFGDGGTSTELNPTHVYTQVGNYTVKLTATNLGGTSAKTSVTPIAVTLPPLPLVNFSYTPASGYAPLTVHFTNRTTGKIDSWVWDFGDGTTSTELNPTHIYAQIGSYTIKLSATNHTGTSTKTSVTPIAVTLPLVNFTFTPASGYAPLTVHFTNRTVGKVDSWAWDFGDNTTSTELSPTHVYAQVGSYTVTLTATSSAGTSTKTSTTPIVATLAPVPVPSFAVTPASGYAPVTVHFINHTPGKVDSWLWDFGDGTTSTELSPTHVYTQVGNYTVKLSATNLHGTGSTTFATPVRALRPGLVAAYSFEEATGPYALDLSTKGHTGVIFGAARVATGKFGKALSFDGTSNWVTVASSPTLNLTTGVTLEAWVNPASSMTGWRDVIMKEQVGGAVYDLYANTGTNQPGGGVFMSSENILSGGSLIPANTWTHLAASYDGVNQILYVNGVQVASRPLSGAVKTSTGPLRIGGDGVWGEYFQGLIDEVRVYNRALSAAEIQADMTSGLAQ